MTSSRLVLIIESDPNAVSQMRRVLAGMKMRALAVASDEELRDAVNSLVREPPALIIARVALPTGSGIRMLEDTVEVFSGARRMLISHHPKSLLMALHGFAVYCANFLQAEFTDDQFRTAVERSLARAAKDVV